MARHKKVHEAALQGEPEASRHVEQEGLDQEVDRDPLVVGVEQVGVAKIGPGVGALSNAPKSNKSTAGAGAGAFGFAFVFGLLDCTGGFGAKVSLMYQSCIECSFFVQLNVVEAEMVLERILHPKCELTHHLVPETNKYGCIIRKRSEK